MCLTPALGLAALPISLADLLGSGDGERACGRARASACAYACPALLKSVRLYPSAEMSSVLQTKAMASVCVCVCARTQAITLDTRSEWMQVDQVRGES